MIHEALLRKLYAAFNARELDQALAGLHPDVDWQNGMEGGRVQGREAVRAYWMRQWAKVDPVVEPTGFWTDKSGRTVVTVRQVVRDLAGKVLLDRVVRHSYTVAGGLVERMDILD